MAEQNTPPGSRAGRPFIPPFRGPTAPGEGGASETPSTAPSTPPERPQPRPFVPAAARPATPSAPARPASRPSPPRPMSPVDASAILRELQTVQSRPIAEESTDELAVEHAISETLGQGAPVPADAALEVERASESSPDALPSPPSLPSLPSPPSPPSLPALEAAELPEESDSDDPLPWAALSEAVAAVEAALTEDPESSVPRAPSYAGDVRGPERGVHEPPSSSEPLPWLTAPVEEPEPPAAEAEKAREASAPSGASPTSYEPDAWLRMTPPPDSRAAVGVVPEPAAVSEPAAAQAPRESSTIVGANLSVAEALERVASRVRAGELRVPAIDQNSGEAGALAAALAVLLGVRS